MNDRLAFQEISCTFTFHKYHEKQMYGEIRVQMIDKKTQCLREKQARHYSFLNIYLFSVHTIIIIRFVAKL